MRWMIRWVALLAMLCPVVVLAQATPPQTAATPQDAASSFVSAVSTNSRFTIEGAKLASTRTRSPDVRKIAQTLLQDHARIGAEAKRLAAQQRLTLADELDARQQAKLEALRKTDRESFDRAYIELQNATHTQTVALVERYAQDGEDGALKRFAQDSVPVLRRHGDMLRQLR